MGYVENWNIFDVVMLVEAKPTIGTNYQLFKSSYILPALEYFNGGQLDNYDFGFSANSTLYCQATYHGLNHIPTVSCSDLFTNPTSYLNHLDNIKFTSRFHDDHSKLCDLLAMGLQIFSDISKLRQNRIEVKKHCIIICDSISSTLPTSPTHPTHPNLTSEEMLKTMLANGVNISIFCPRKIQIFSCLKELMDLDSTNLQKNFAVNPKHFILLNGLVLPEVPIVNSVKTEEIDIKNVTNAVSTRSLTGVSVVKSQNENSGMSTKENITNTSAASASRIVNSFNLAAPSANPPRRQVPMSTVNPISILEDTQKINNPTVAMPSGQVQQNMNQQNMSQQNMGQQNMGQQNINQNMGQQNMNQNVILQNMGQQNMGQQNMGQQNMGQQNMVQQNMGQQNMGQLNMGQQQQLMGQQNIGIAQSMDSNILVQPQGMPPMGQHRAIWNGLLEWQEKSKQPTSIPPRMLYSIRCQLMIPFNEADIPTNQWPEKLNMTLIPHSVLSPLSALFKNSRSLIFLFSSQPSDKETLDNLSRMLVNGYGGCIYIHPTSETSNDVKVLVLLYSSKKQQYLGLIPLDQSQFLLGIRSVITKHKNAGAKLMGADGDLNMGGNVGPNAQLMNQMQMSSMQAEDQERRNMQFHQQQQQQQQQQMGVEQRQLLAMQQQQQQLQQQRLQMQHQMQQSHQPLRHLLMSNQPVRSQQHMLMRSMPNNNAQMFSMPQQHLNNHQQFLNDDMHMDLP